MTMTLNVQETLEAVMSKLEKVLTTKTVFGEPVQLGDVTLIPVVDIMFGFGSGGGEGTAKDNSGGGSGGGGAARVAAKAVIAVKGGEVSVLPMAKGGALEKLLEMVPAMVDKVQVKKAEQAAEPGKE